MNIAEYRFFMLFRIVLEVSWIMSAQASWTSPKWFSTLKSPVPSRLMIARKWKPPTQMVGTLTLKLEDFREIFFTFYFVCRRIVCGEKMPGPPSCEPNVWSFPTNNWQRPRLQKCIVLDLFVWWLQHSAKRPSLVYAFSSDHYAELFIPDSRLDVSLDFYMFECRTDRFNYFTFYWKNVSC